MLKNILELLTLYKVFAVEFDNYEQACELLKFLEDNTNIVWRSGDKPTECYRYFKENYCYLVIGSRLSIRGNWRGIDELKLYKCSELLREPPKCLKRL